MTTGQELVDFAKRSLGVKYVWGGTDLQNGVDCSGLLQSVFSHFGISIPRVTYNQINAGASVGMSDLRPGDMIFFDPAKDGQPDHVGMYIGGGKFIHAPHTGDVVKISNLSDSYYADRFMGGRRIAGVTNDGYSNESPTDVGNAASNEASQPTVHLSGEELAERYSMSYAFFQAQPELMNMLKQAVAEQWDPSRWTAELKNTSWWKDNSDTMRQAAVLEKTDPATFKAQMDAAQASLRMQANQMGAVVSDGQLAQAARNVIALGWQEAQIKDYLGQYIDFTDKHVLGGQAGAMYRQITSTAYRNGVALDDQTAKNYAAYIGRGITTMQGTLDQIRQQAAGAYPAYAQQLLAGQDLASIASPYMQAMAKTFDLPTGGVDLTTPEIKSALTNKGHDGQPQALSLTDFQTQLRGDPRYRQTQAAMDNTMAVGGQVLRDMGLI